MNFKEAVRTCVKDKYATFSGRAPRSEIWWLTLFYFLVAIMLVVGGLALNGWSVDAAGGFSIGAMILLGLYAIFALAMFLPMLAVTVRRFHDVNLSGWWYLVCMLAGLIPFVGIIGSLAIFVIMVWKGTSGPNRFGNDPLRPESSAEIFS